MKKHLTYGLVAICLLIFGCENGNPTGEDNTDYTSVTTSDTTSESWYYDLATGASVTSSDSWHISVQGVIVDPDFPANPSVILGSGVYVSVSDTQEFATATMPAMDTFSVTTDNVSFNGSDEILTYSHTAHLVTTSSKLYFIYDTVTHTVYKVSFDEYSSGIVLLKYAEMPQ